MWRASVFPSVRVSGPVVRLSGPVVRLSSPAVRLSGLICLLMLGASAVTPHASFRYQLLSTWRLEACRMCFGDNCWPLQTARCQYYAEADEVLGKSETDGGGSEIDDLVQDMVTQASSSWEVQECIPFISYHTDCNKENICVGCNACSCDSLGRWRCGFVQRCRPDPVLDVDHMVLVSVMDNLKSDKISRRKRSAFEDKTDESKKPPHNISYTEVAEWMYGAKLNGSSHNDITGNGKPEFSTVKVETEEEYIKFDEVLKNIESHRQIRRKPQLNERAFDYMDLDNVVVVKTNDTDQFTSILNDIINDNETTVTDQTVDESTKVVIDLLASLKKDDNLNVKSTDYMDVNNSHENEADNSNETIPFDAINIMKRDLSYVANSFSTTEVAVATDNANSSNTNKSVTGLQNNVLTPLNKIIVDKQQELKDLIKIKENLIQFMKDYNNTKAEINSTSREVVNGSNTVLSIYNLDIFPEIQFDLRKINPNVLDKWLYKLKRDIYEVIRDVVGIKKISTTNKLPDDLKTLIRAMSFYVRKQSSVANSKDNITGQENNSRRQWDEEPSDQHSTKDYLIQILEFIDKDIQSNVLSSLYHGTSKIVNRVIKNYYANDFSAIGLRVYDPEYNLTNDLRSIGRHWKPMMANIAVSSPAEKIYAMKLLHFTLSSDIDKLHDAVALIDYAHSRRMIPIEAELGDELLDEILNRLDEIHDKIKRILHYKMNNNDVAKANQNKKTSFINKIRNLLKGSKNDIVELVNNKVPRSEIVKTIAKKRLDELAEKKIYEYQETMRKWQNALNVIPRNKRSLDLEKVKNRMKNIIPKYLRGKLNPAITAKRSKRNQARKKVAGKEHNKKRSKIGATTMRIKTSTKSSDNGVFHTARHKVTDKKRTKSNPKTIMYS